MSLLKNLSIRSAKTSNVQHRRRVEELPPKIDEPTSVLPTSKEDEPTPIAPSNDMSSEKTIEEGDVIRRDPLFYHIPLIILVEGTLFKVSRIYFEKHSEVFCSTYLRPSKGDNQPEGLTDGQPLRLDGVDASEFKALIKAMIQMDLEEDADMSWVEWTAVLQLAMIWKMELVKDWAISQIPAQIHGSDEYIAMLKLSTQLKIKALRELAIQALANDLGLLQKLELATECSVDPWLSDVYSVFVNRAEGLSYEDEEKMGWERTSTLFRLRNSRYEQLQAFEAEFSRSGRCSCESCYRSWCGETGGVKRCYDVESAIRTTFANEFAAMAAFDNSPPVLNLRLDIKTVTHPEAMQRDGTYYFVDIIFLVEDTLFKVPRSLFEQSSIVFRDMFLLPAVEGMVPDGSTEYQPLRLQGIQKAHFRRLLTVIKCPTSKSLATKGSKVADKTLPIALEDWASVLELSCMWQMDKIREMATKKILDFQANTDQWSFLLKLATKLGMPEIREPAIRKLSQTLPPIEMVELGIECRVHTWLLQGYSSLALKTGGITLEDEKRLGRKTTSKLFRIREIVFLPAVREGFMTNEIKRLFAEELKDSGWDGK